eukprot:13765837-Heterocapsa_arctica.AAC.1
MYGTRTTQRRVLAERFRGSITGAMADFAATNMMILELAPRMPVDKAEKAPSESGESAEYEE